MRGNRIFRALLRLFPAEFRGDFGDDMAATFDDQRRATLAHGGRMAGLQLWTDTVLGILTTAPREHLDVLRGDVRYALRNLRRNPGFTAVAVIALAVGIGANTAVFTIVNGVLLRALPYREPDALVSIFEELPSSLEKFAFSAPDLEIVKSLSQSYSGMAPYRSTTFELSGTIQPERIVGTRVSPDLFDVLGVAPALGRAMTADEDRATAKVVVLSNGLWTRAFGRDPTLVGRSISLDGQPYTVIGIMPEAFVFPPRGGQGFSGEPADVYLPISFTPIERQAFGSMYNNSVVARLKPGVSIERARAELTAIVPPLLQRYPPILTNMARGLSLPISSLVDEVVGERRRMIVVLMAAVAMVLLIGCADVANLMLTRAGARQREIAVRSALGASRARVVRQLMTEGLVLASIGAAAGLVLAFWTLQALLSMAGTVLPRAESIQFDGRTVLFTLVLAMATPMLFAIVPAVRAALHSTFDALKDGTRAATPGRARHRLLASFVVAQFALALMLSVGAGLLVRSFIRLLATDPGFRSRHAVTASVTLPVGRYAGGPQVRGFYQRAIDAVRTIPGVSAVGASTDRALNVWERRTFTADASAVQLPVSSRMIAASWTAGNYFQAMGISLQRGRFFVEGDGEFRPGAHQVVIVSEMLAKKLWPNQDPIGRQIKWGVDATSPNPWMTIVGVVGDMKEDALGTETVPMTYEPVAQLPNPVLNRFYRTVNVVARTDGDAYAAVAALRRTLQGIDPSLPITHAQPLEEVVTESVKPQRFSMTVVAAFALVALGLAAIGIFGVLSNAVAQETHEIGVRMALGAQASALLWSVLRRALMLMAGGAAIGIAGALALTRVMTGLLYEVQPTDAPAFIGSVLVLGNLAVAAALVPAWRATRVDPLTALRAE